MVRLKDEAEKPVIGPKCELCDKHYDFIFPLYIKRERRGQFEMVRIFVCAMHFLEYLEQAPELPLPPPPDDYNDWEKFMHPEDDEEDEEDFNNSVTDHIGQSFG
jgi:hypothetical protein